MRKIPHPPGGLPEWQTGWQTGYMQCLIDHGHEQDHDGPRTWAIEYPPAPPAGTRVRNTEAPRPIATVGENGQVVLDDVTYAWREFVETWGPLTEVVETEVEAAARRLRESDSWRGGEHATDIATVLAHVLNGGQL